MERAEFRHGGAGAWVVGCSEKVGALCYGEELLVQVKHSGLVQDIEIVFVY